MAPTGYSKQIDWRGQGSAVSETTPDEEGAHKSGKGSRIEACSQRQRSNHRETALLQGLQAVGLDPQTSPYYLENSVPEETRFRQIRFISQAALYAQGLGRAQTVSIHRQTHSWKAFTDPRLLRSQAKEKDHAKVAAGMQTGWDRRSQKTTAQEGVQGS